MLSRRVERSPQSGEGACSDSGEVRASGRRGRRRLAGRMVVVSPRAGGWRILLEADQRVFRVLLRSGYMQGEVSDRQHRMSVLRKSVMATRLAGCYAR
jgi:hypothetical protein